MDINIKSCPFWLKEINGYEGRYWVTAAGNIINSDGRVMRPYDNGYGYLVVELRNGGKRKHERVHRLVAKAFIPNTNNLPEVNHKDENKHNNAVDNLEWCNSQYNKRYGSGRKTRSEGMKRVWAQRRADDGKTD